MKQINEIAIESFERLLLNWETRLKTVPLNIEQAEVLKENIIYLKSLIINLKNQEVLQ